ncbi:MAG: DUF4176 domain-containing protein [Lachnospiraceae bacterium]
MTVKELLPIGSIILLEGGKKRLMVYGVKQNKEDTKEEFDYIGVIYPEGNIGTQGQFLFNHKDIAQVYFRGYDDEERTHFIEKLDEYYSKMQS